MKRNPSLASLLITAGALLNAPKQTFADDGNGDLHPISKAIATGLFVYVVLLICCVLTDFSIIRGLESAVAEKFGNIFDRLTNRMGGAANEGRLGRRSNRT